MTIKDPIEVTYTEFLGMSETEIQELHKRALEDKKYTGVIVGVRADEEGTRAKERYFSARNQYNDWEFREQPPELWDQFKTKFAPGTHVRIHPLRDWTENPGQEERDGLCFNVIKVRRTLL